MDSKLIINIINEQIIHKNKNLTTQREKEIVNKSFSVNAHKHPLTPTTHRQ